MESESYPVSVFEYLQNLKKGWTKPLTFIILHYKRKPLTKRQMAEEGERLGKSRSIFYRFLNSTLNSPHGGLKGLVVPAGTDGRERTFELSPLGKKKAGELIREIEAKVETIASTPTV